MHAGAVLLGCVAAWGAGAAALLSWRVLSALWSGESLVRFDPAGVLQGLLLAGAVPALAMTVVALVGAALAALLRATVTPPMVMAVAFVGAASICYGLGIGRAIAFGSASFVAACAGAGWLTAFGARWCVRFGRPEDR